MTTALIESIVIVAAAALAIIAGGWMRHLFRRKPKRSAVSVSELEDGINDVHRLRPVTEAAVKACIERAEAEQRRSLLYGAAKARREASAISECIERAKDAADDARRRAAFRDKFKASQEAYIKRAADGFERALWDVPPMSPLQAVTRDTASPRYYFVNREYVHKVKGRP